MKNTTVSVFTRSVYGRTLVYPANPEHAKALASLTGTKTLEHRHLQGLEALGFTIAQVPDPAAWLSPANVAALRRS